MFLCRGAAAGAAGDGRGGAGGGPVPVRLRRHQGDHPMNRLPVAILAGGLATRLGPLTEQTPKCLIEVAGRPFVHHQLRQLRGQGVRRVVLCLGHLGEQVVEAVGDGSAFGLEVDVLLRRPGVAGNRRRDPAGPAAARAGVLRPLRRLVPGCDYAAVQEAFEAAGKLALMTVFRNEGRWDTSNVEFRDGRILAYDKAHGPRPCSYIDYGLGVLDRRAFEVVPEAGACDLAAVHQEMLRRGELAGLRSRSGSTRSARSRGSRRPGDTWPGGSEPAAGPPEEMMSHAAQFLDEAKQVIDGLDVEAIERMATLLEQVRDARRPAVHPGRRRQRGQCLARRQRLPQDRRHRGLRPDRQRLGADGPDQRRGLADHLRGMAAGQPAEARGPDPRALGGRRQPGEERQPQPGHGPAIRPGGRHPGHRHRRQGRRLHGQGGRGLRDRADGQPRAHHAALRGVPGRRLAPAGLAPAAQGARQRSGSRSR